MAWIRKLLGARHTDHSDHRIEWRPGWLTVILPGGRSQRVRYEERGSSVRLVSAVAQRPELHALGLSPEALAHVILRRNRETRVVAFGFGKYQRVEAWVSTPRDQLQRSELLYYLLTLAREADRFEYLLTRADRS